MFPEIYATASYHVIANVKLGINPIYANTHDSDFLAVLSNGENATGFLIPDHSNYGYPYYHEPCFHVEGTPGNSLTDFSYYNNGPRINTNNPVPQEFEFFFSTKQKWSSCVTATAYEGSYTTSGHYSVELQANNGLYFDIYSEDNRGEVYNFKYIMVDIQTEIDDAENRANV